MLRLGRVWRARVAARRSTGAASVAARVPAGARADREFKASRATVAGATDPTASRFLPARAAGSFRRGTHLDEPSHVERRPLVSFGLPVRNGASTIAQAIESVLAQTFEDWELVISDNLSTDGTSEICASFAARDERIRHVPTGRDLSIHENFRAAFHHSRGTYFRWHGDDDWLEPLYAERAVAALEASPGSVLCTTVQQYHRDGQPLPVNDPIPVLGGVDSPDAGTRVRALLHLFENGGTSESTRSTHWYGGTSLHRRAFKAPFVTGTSCTRARWRSSGRSSTYRRSWHIADCCRCPGSGSRGTSPTRAVDRLRRQSSKSLTTRSRIRVSAALVAFTAREHAHGVRRRARAVKERYRTRRGG